MKPANELWVVYDGQCPFCSRYVLLYRLRESLGRVHMVDARSGDPIMAEIRARGLNLDEGMAVKWQGHFYHGAQALGVLAMLGSNATVFNRMNRWLFNRPRLARALYPWMVRGRILTLRLMGRRLINEGGETVAKA